MCSPTAWAASQSQYCGASTMRASKPMDDNPETEAPSPPKSRETNASVGLNPIHRAIATAFQEFYLVKPLCRRGV